MGSIKIASRGGQNHAPTRDDISAQFALQFGMTLD
jgi:adenosine kinase